MLINLRESDTTSSKIDLPKYKVDLFCAMKNNILFVLKRAALENRKVQIRTSIPAEAAEVPCQFQIGIIEFPFPVHHSSSDWIS